MEIDDVPGDLVRVGSLVMHIEEFQIVLRVIVVRLCAVQENDVTLPCLPFLSAVLHIEDASAHIDDQERRVGIPFHIVAR